MRFVCFSDTHGEHDRLDVPDGDVLIFTGDMSAQGSAVAIHAFDLFLASLPHSYKIVIAGNHDLLFQTNPERARSILQHAHYLQDTSVTIEGIKIYGSPWQPKFMNWAFNLERASERRYKWSLIPSDTDILLTHCPPKNILDRVHYDHHGCEELTHAIRRIKPKYHIFGHIHEEYGTTEQNGTIFKNVSVLDGEYRLCRQCDVFEYTK